MSRKKIVVYMEDDNTGMVYDDEHTGNYIGTILLDKVVEYEEPAYVDPKLALEFIKAGVAPKDLIELKRNDLI